MQKKRPDVPRLVPTGNVDEVLLTGKSHGKELTPFQSIGLALLGLWFVIFSGIPQMAHEFILESKSQGVHTSYPMDLSDILWHSLMCLLGGVWLVLGLVGVTKVARKKKHPQLRCDPIRTRRSVHN